MNDYDNKITLLWLICGFEYKAREIESSIGLDLDQQLELITELINEGVLNSDLIKVSRTRKNKIKMIRIPKSAIIGDHCKEIDEALHNFEIRTNKLKKRK